MLDTKVGIAASHVTVCYYTNAVPLSNSHFIIIQDLLVSVRRVNVIDLFGTESNHMITFLKCTRGM